MQHFKQLARFAAISTILLTLAACGGGGSDSDDDDDNGGDGGAPLTNINGAYVSECLVTSATESTEFIYVAQDGDLVVTRNDYMDDACTVNPIASLATATYVLGGSVGLDGSVAGITSATEIDITNTTVGSPDLGEITYDIVAIDGDTVYVGQSDGVNDGSTPALRHTELDGDFPLTRQ